MKAFLVAGVATALFACFAGVARADVASIPTGNDPWTGGAAVTSPLDDTLATLGALDVHDTARPTSA